MAATTSSPIGDGGNIREGIIDEAEEKLLENNELATVLKSREDSALLSAKSSKKGIFIYKYFLKLTSST